MALSTIDRWFVRSSSAAVLILVIRPVCFLREFKLDVL